MLLTSIPLVLRANMFPQHIWNSEWIIVKEDLSEEVSSKLQSGTSPEWLERAIKKGREEGHKFDKLEN